MVALRQIYETVKLLFRAVGGTPEMYIMTKYSVIYYIKAHLNDLHFWPTFNLPALNKRFRHDSNFRKRIRKGRTKFCPIQATFDFHSTSFRLFSALSTKTFLNGTTIRSTHLAKSRNRLKGP